MKKIELDALIVKIKANKDAAADLDIIVKNMTAAQKTSLEKNDKIKGVLDKHKKPEPPKAPN